MNLSIEAMTFGNDLTDAASMDLVGWMVRQDPTDDDAGILFISLSLEECGLFAEEYELNADR